MHIHSTPLPWVSFLPLDLILLTTPNGRNVCPFFVGLCPVVPPCWWVIETWHMPQLAQAEFHRYRHIADAVDRNRPQHVPNDFDRGNPCAWRTWSLVWSPGNNLTVLSALVSRGWNEQLILRVSFCYVSSADNQIGLSPHTIYRHNTANSPGIQSGIHNYT